VRISWKALQWMAKGTSFVLPKIFIRFGKHSLKEMFTKISSCELCETRCSESHTSVYRGGGLNKFQFPPFEFILSIWVKFGTRNPQLKLTSNCEFVENLPVEVLVVSKRIVVITPSVLRQARNLFQSEFSTQCDLVLPLSISSTLSFP
jgi:hypothetical protein